VTSSASSGGATSSLACKSWCLPPGRKETGMVTVDTYPKVYNGTNVTALQQQALGKIVLQ
jgi:hypothetical protein